MPNNVAYEASNPGTETQEGAGLHEVSGEDLGIFDDSCQQVGQMRPHAAELCGCVG